MILRREVTLRLPFELRKHPLHVRLYRRMYDNDAAKRIANVARSEGGFFHTAVKRTFVLLWRHLPTGRPTFYYHRDGITVEVPYNPRNTQYHALYLGRYAHGYEPEISAFLDCVLRDDGVFYDIGANWGYFSLFTTSRHGFRGEVHAFEPLLSAYQDLAGVVKSSGVGHLVTPHNLALADEAGTGCMSVPDGMHSGLAQLNHPSPANVQHVTVARLDDLPLSAPTVMKIDAEGYEAEIIAGGREVIRETRPFIFFESWARIHKWYEPIRGKQSPTAVFEELERLGYLFFMPGWLVDRVHIPSNHALFRKSPSVQLVLDEFEAGGRFMHGDKINCLAVHPARLDELVAVGFTLESNARLLA